MTVVGLTYGGYTPHPSGTTLTQLDGLINGNTLAQLLEVNPGLLADTAIGRTTPVHFLIFDSVPTGVGGEDFAPVIIDTSLLPSYQTLPGYAAQQNTHYANTANSAAHLRAANPGITSTTVPLHLQVSLMIVYQPYVAPPPPASFGTPVHTAMRLLQRNDGLGPSGHPRITNSSIPNGASSTQLQRPPRIGTANLIDPGVNVEGGTSL